MKEPIFFNSQDPDSELAKELLREAGVDFIEIIANDVFEPTIVTEESAYPFEGLEEIKTYIEVYHKK